MRKLISCAVLAFATLGAVERVDAADPADGTDRLADQRRAMQPLAIFDGAWRGPATATLDDGRSVPLTQTARVGSFLAGSLKLIEGKGYAQDGSVAFNAFGIISFSPRTGQYSFRWYRQGHTTDSAVELAPDGLTWTVDAGGTTVRYTATVKNGVWSEIGERIVDGQPATRVYEMTLRRISDTDWPEAGKSAQ